MVHVKVCGLSRVEDVHAARDAAAVGFIVASPRSHRNLALEAARDVMAARAPFQLGVAVTAATDADTLRRILALVRPDALQCPARVDAALLRALRMENPHVRFLLATRVEDAAHVPLDLADAVVLDAMTADGYGGSGKLADWDAAAALAPDLDGRVILAGGLTPGNVAEAIAKVRPYAVDVSSGVEGPDRLKDAGLVRAFLRAVRLARHAPDAPGAPNAPDAPSPETPP